MNSHESQIASRFVKLAISLGFFSASFLRDMLRSIAGKPSPGTCVVLYYHDVPSEYRERFARQMDLLLLLARPVRANVKQSLPAGERSVAITFDDGYCSTISNALPELEKRGIPSTFFVVSDALGQLPPWLAKNGNSSQGGDQITTEEQLRGLSSSLVEVGSHSMTHPRLPALPEEQAKQEILESRKKLERILGRQVRLFSFPHGEFNESLVHWCRQAGYDRVFTILPSLAFLTPEEYLTGRVWAEPTDWNLEFRLKVLGAYRWLPQAFLWKRKFFGMLGRGLKQAHA